MKGKKSVMLEYKICKFENQDIIASSVPVPSDNIVYIPQNCPITGGNHSLSMGYDPAIGVCWKCDCGYSDSMNGSGTIKPGP